MSILTSGIREDKEYSQLLSAIEKEHNSKVTLPLLVTGLCDGAADSLFISLFEDIQKKHGTSLVVCSDEKECLRLCNLLNANSIKSAFFQSRDLTFYNISASHDYEHERLKVLYELYTGNLDAVTVTPDTLLGYTVPPKRLNDATVFFDYSAEVDLMNLATVLVKSGYKKVELKIGRAHV